jgi:enoyl-CoA hydratase/carnithine racemase
MRQITRVFTSLHTRARFNKVDVKVEDKIGYIYLNSPSDLNALSLEMRSAISGAVREHEKSNDVKVILFLSKVAKAFCAGANIKEFQGRKAKDFDNNDIFAELHDTLYNAKKPIVAGVNGVALGGGC